MTMKKKPLATMRLVLLAGNLTPSPLLGQALGQYGINIMHFCKQFNSLTKNLQPHICVRVTLVIEGSAQFDVLVKTPSNTFLLITCASISKGSSVPGKTGTHKGVPQSGAESSGFVYTNELFHLAQLKACDRFLHHLGPLRLCKSFLGSAKSMGLTVLSSSPAVAV